MALQCTMNVNKHCGPLHCMYKIHTLHTAMRLIGDPRSIRKLQPGIRKNRIVLRLKNCDPKEIFNWAYPWLNTLSINTSFWSSEPCTYYTVRVHYTYTYVHYHEFLNRYLFFSYLIDILFLDAFELFKSKIPKGMTHDVTFLDHCAVVVLARSSSGPFFHCNRKF